MSSQPHTRFFSSPAAETIACGIVGLWLGIVLLKFGNPPFFDSMVESPSNVWELLFWPWPIRWGYLGLILMVLLSLSFLRFKVELPAWLAGMPLIWFGWQLVAAVHTIDAALTQTTLSHFSAILASYYLGLFVFGRFKQKSLIWMGLFLGFAFALLLGFEQHSGGLEQTRRMVYSQPNWQSLQPEYLKRIASNRIFSSFLYPNSFAGAILLLLPPLAVTLWRWTSLFSLLTQALAASLLGFGGLACLYWTSSKSGWLIALLMIIACLIRLIGAHAKRSLIVGGVFVCGLALFFLNFRGYFERGATSVSARFDYWNAAWKTTVQNPLFGTGPGTFGKAYKRIKRPESEMTKLTHNDYLEQASDSGFVGFITYATMVVAHLAFLYRKSYLDSMTFAVWIGLFGWFLQGLVEFGLYIPSTCWTGFFILGCYAGCAGCHQVRNQIDKRLNSTYVHQK